MDRDSIRDLQLFALPAVAFVAPAPSSFSALPTSASTALLWLALIRSRANPASRKVSRLCVNLDVYCSSIPREALFAEATLHLLSAHLQVIEGELEQWDDAGWPPSLRSMYAREEVEITVDKCELVYDDWEAYQLQMEGQNVGSTDEPADEPAQPI